MNTIKKCKYILPVVLALLFFSVKALAVEYSPGLRIKTVGEESGKGLQGVSAVIQLPGNAEIKGVGETGAAYNYLGLELSNGNNFEIGLTKDKYDLEQNRWSVFAYANYNGAFSLYETEGKWVNFRRDGALFKGPEITVPDGSTVTISLKVVQPGEAVFEISGHEPVLIKAPGANPEEEGKVFRRVTSLMTDDSGGFFKNTRWSGTKIIKGGNDDLAWNPDLSETWLSNNMDKNDPSSDWVSVSMSEPGSETIDIILNDRGTESPYAFEIQSQSDKKLQVQFKGNEMYHGNRYVGFGVNGKPMLALRYLAQEFGFRVDYDPETGTSLVKKGQYSFGLHPGGGKAGIYWAGEKIREFELTASPVVKNNALYLYSLDLKELLGLITYWDNNARVWDVLYREYACKELSFPAVVKDDLLTLRGLLIDDGQHDLPGLEILAGEDGRGAHHYSLSMLEKGEDSRRRYEMNSEFPLREGHNRLQILLCIGQRLIFHKEIEVTTDLEAKELVVEPPYQLSCPTRGYNKTTEAKLTISGSVAAINGAYPEEVVLFAQKTDKDETRREERIPVNDGQFNHELYLKNGAGLYKVTLNSVMAGPRGPAYLEITNFFVELED